MANEIDPAHLSRDPEEGRTYAADPLVRRVVSARWFSEAERTMKAMPAVVARIEAPVLILHGTEDKLAPVDATRAVFDRIGSKDKELRLYRGFYHELFNEPEKQDIFQTVGDWLSGHLR
jgi:alpha-beta hydrolase superfamily lysophospholipase